MKKLAFTILLTLSITTATSKTFIQELKHAVGTSPEVSINLGSWLFNTMLSFSNDEDVQEAKVLMQGLDKIKVTVFDISKANNLKKVSSVVKSKIKKLSNSGYETLVTVKDEGDLVYIVAKVNGQLLQDAMIIALEENDELVVISLQGEVDLEQLAKISDEFDVNIADI